MTSTLLLQLLLVSLASASHHYGGTVTFTYKGRNPDGTFKVDIRNRETFDGCLYHHYWSCYTGNCGYSSRVQRGVLDRSTNAPRYNSQWCETETVTTRHVFTDKPFEMRARSCCWIPARNPVSYWNFLTSLDLGTRSDTRKPNRSPDVAILPLLRIPQNCPRTYRLMSFDPDGDRVRCRYGNIPNLECTSCNLPSGFILDQSSCMLHYQFSSANYGVYGFELVVEDFPQRSITLAYADGSRSTRAPLTARRRRSVMNPMTTSSPTTGPPSTIASWWGWWPATTASPWGWWQTPAMTAAPTQTASPWGWWQTPAMTAAPTQTASPWGWWQTPAMRAAPTQTASPWGWWQTPAMTAAPTQTASPWGLWPTTTSTSHTTGQLYATTPPLSKLPLQFSFLVDPPVPSCQEGLYLPRLVHPTPANAARVQAEANKEVEIRVKAQASYATLHDIIMSGPTNITKHRTTHDEFVIKWTPTEDDLGDHYPICFAVESRWGSSIYQSEMRCVLVDVIREEVETTVICTESTMTVVVERSSIPGIDVNRLRLSDPANTACSLHSNSTHVIGVIPLNACGTQIEEDEENLMFKNEITTVDNGRDVITRKHLLEVQFYCQYPKRGNVTLGFTAHRNNVTVFEKGFGTFTYAFEFFPNAQFWSMIDPNSYPLEYDIGDEIFMQIEATSTVNNTELFVESCRAAPYDTPNYSPTYSIIENGCNVDSTVETYSPAHERQFRFSMEAFKFIGLHDQVYISCSVIMCEAGEPNTRCSQGCINSTQSARRKREATTQSGIHFVSQGPLRLRRSAELRESPVMNLNLNLVFIAGCLLAAVGMISAAVMYKSKMLRVRYQPLPTSES
uniref:uncharacterized protein LOC124063513 isoform X2 n=1 Tax=Scatophagus argus TaxID=75038 RepID=UPI001ED80F10|nr:uncharacterized protein LOC124063513 isoform X2 [Scatophagus argus]